MLIVKTFLLMLMMALKLPQDSTGRPPRLKRMGMLLTYSQTRSRCAAQGRILFTFSQDDIPIWRALTKQVEPNNLSWRC
jgi:hypothetical protein